MKYFSFLLSLLLIHLFVSLRAAQFIIYVEQKRYVNFKTILILSNLL